MHLNNRLYKSLACIALITLTYVIYVIYFDGFVESLYAKNKSFKRVCVMSVNVNSPENYIFHLPIAALAWKRIGFEPLILIVHSNMSDMSRLDMKTIEYLNQLDIRIFYVETTPSYEKITAMIVRLFIGLLPGSLIDDNDFILTSDTDLYPIKSSYYNIYSLFSEKILIWNAYCCGYFNYKGEQFVKYPMGHIGMKKRLWRELMNLDANNVLTGKLVLDKIDNFFGPNTTKTTFVKTDFTWELDQTWISVNIKYSRLPIKKIDYTGFRIDRSHPAARWNLLINYLFSWVTDVHSYQEGQVLLAWPQLNMLLKKMFESHQINILNKFFTEYSSIYFDKL